MKVFFTFAVWGWCASARNAARDPLRRRSLPSLSARFKATAFEQSFRKSLRRNRNMRDVNTFGDFVKKFDGAQT